MSYILRRGTETIKRYDLSYDNLDRILNEQLANKILNNFNMFVKSKIEKNTDTIDFVMSSYQETTTDLIKKHTFTFIKDIYDQIKTLEVMNIEHSDIKLENIYFCKKTKHFLLGDYSHIKYTRLSNDLTKFKQLLTDNNITYNISNISHNIPEPSVLIETSKIIDKYNSIKRKKPNEIRRQLMINKTLF